jgi:hypothetical protein
MEATQHVTPSTAEMPDGLGVYGARARKEKMGDGLISFSRSRKSSLITFGVTLEIFLRHVERASPAIDATACLR